MDTLLANHEIIFKLFFSAFLGGLIGLERDKKGRAAGLRTHILVALGSALFMIISNEIYQLYDGSNATSVLRIDPGRIAAQIITGIGFIGAGAILQLGLNIRGLTTAGSIWVSAGIGMAVGIEYYVPAIVTTVVALFSLIVLNKIETIYFKDAYIKLVVEMKDHKSLLEDFKNYIKTLNIDLRTFKFDRDFEKKNLLIIMILKMKYRTRKNFYSKKVIEGIEEQFGELIKKISWKEPDDN